MYLDETTNPFSTRFVAPGRLPFLFESEAQKHRIIKRLFELQTRCAIVGPHGVGKTTLLRQLEQELKQLSKPTRWFEFHASDSSSPQRISDFREGEVTFIDGFEQLSIWRRWQLIRQAKAKQAGLVVTTHRKSRLRTLVDFSPTYESLEQVLIAIEHQLLAGEANQFEMSQGWNLASRYRSYRSSLSLQAKRSLFQRHRGNIREILFELYDHWESQRLVFVGTKGSVRN